MARQSTDDWEDGDEADVRDGWREGRPDEFDASNEDFDEVDGQANDDDGSDTAPCPKCNAEIYDLADYCPICGEAIAPQQAPLSRRTIIAGGTLVLLILMGTMLWTCR